MKRLITIFLAIVGLVLFQQSCKSNENTSDENRKVTIDPRFNEFINAFTGGIVSSNANITIQLRTPLPDDWVESGEVDGLFSFSPSLSGKTVVKNATTVTFIPDDLMKSGELYKASFTLGKVADVPLELETFEFNFQTLHQNLRFNLESFHTPDISKPQNIEVLAEIKANDIISDKLELSQFISVEQNGSGVAFEAQKTSSKSIGIRVKDIVRGDKSSDLAIRWKGMMIGAENGEEIVKIPGKNDFSIAKIQVVNGQDQHVKIHFSDPLEAMQDIEGMVEIGSSNLRLEINEHTILAYPTYHLNGSKTLTINSGIKNFNGKRLGNRENVSIEFRDLNPEVKFLGDGNIMPSKDKVTFPIQSVNLEAVDLIITKIYENNLTQFFQVNDIDGTYQLSRVGEKVLQQKVWLDPKGQKNLNEWNTFEIPLTDYMSFDKGTLYRIEVRFKKEYSVYPCGDEDEAENTLITSQFDIDYDEPWNERDWDSYYYYDDYWDGVGYDYSERKNPCSESYYRYKTVSTNFLSSNIGLIAKAGKDKKLNVFVTNLLTTEPISNASIRIYDYQQQSLGTTMTNFEGMAEIQSDEKPFLIIAEHNGEKAFLKLYDHDANSLSKFFDVSGQTVQQGVKGMIYTERGVWRPGDSLYISFMLEDKENMIPDNHPVVFSFRNPRGQLVDQQVSYRGLNGLYDFRTATDQDALTGNYRVSIDVGARSFNEYLKVEAIKPNRLKINLNHESDDKYFTQGEKFVLQSRWLHGAEAGGLRARVEATLRPTRTNFKDYEKYSFDDQSKYFSSENKIVFEGLLDESGKVEFDPDINIGQAASGHLSTAFSVKVFEKSGNFSVDEERFTYSPFSSYAGMKMPEYDFYGYAFKTGKDYTIDVARVSDMGKAKDGMLEVTMYKLEWRWWWDSYSHDLASYISRSSTIPFKRDEVNLSNGKGSFKFSARDDQWGRYFIRVKDPVSGHTAGKVIYVDRPYWSNENRRDKSGQAMLAMSTDKKKYEVGEDVKVTFPSPSEGRALVTIENGTRVLEKKWVEVTKGETSVSLETDADMTPNVFIHVMLIQPHEETANDLPIRMYGVVPIAVENKNSHLTPEIDMPEVWRPESKVRVRVSEKDNKKMTYTLAIVDEGLLDLTNFQTPDPYSHFNAHEALGVKTWDMYDDVMDAIQKNDKLLAIGGGADGGKPKSAKANRFEPMVRFLGPFELRGGSKTHTIDIPNYVGSVRVMVVAGEDERYGNAEQTAFVRNPLMVLGTMPRVLAPGDQLEIPADIFAMEKHVKNVTVTIESDNMIEMFGAKAKKLTFSQTGDKMVYFPAKVANKSGIAKVKITAKSGKEVAYDEIEIDVRQPIGRIYQTKESYVEKGASVSGDVTPFGINNSYEGTLELSLLPPVDLTKRLDYLISYPHGCIEQTVSRAFPQLYLSSMIDLTKKQKEETQQNINAAFEKLMKHQTNEGGFSYWPGNPYSSEWGSSYAAHFIVEAEEKGYKVPSGMKNAVLKFLKQKSRDWSQMNSDKEYRYNDLGQAYRLYILAKAGKPEWGAMNRLREQRNLSQPASWRLAGAYALAGKTNVADKMIYDLETDIPSYREMAFSFGSDIRDEAMILEVLVEMGQKNKGAYVAKRLAKKVSESEWMSTQTTAYSLLALSKFFKEAPSNKNVTFQYRLDNGSFKTATIAKGVVKIPLKNANTYEVKANNEALFVQEVRSGIPAFGEEPAAANNLRMDVNYMTIDGKTIDPASIVQGQEFIAHVSIFNPGAKGYLRNMALEQIFPSGWEIVNERMSAAAGNSDNSYYNYRDYRDDRVYTYFSLGEGKRKVFEVRLIASFSGEYKFPATRAYAMYDETVAANTAGRTVTVISDQQAPF